MTCELCKKNSGLTNNKLECCQIRYLAQMPNHRLKEAATRFSKEEREILKPKIEAERKRLRELLNEKKNKIKYIQTGSTELK